MTAIRATAAFELRADESAPAEVVTDDRFSNDRFNAFGTIAQHPDGTIFALYREGGSHVGPRDYGTVCAVAYPHRGSRSPEPTLLFREEGVDLRNVAGGFTAAGRLVVAYGRYNPDTTTWLSIEVRCSDDNGLTWLDSHAITVGREASFSPHGNLVSLPDGRLVLGWYGDDGARFTQYLAFSDDDGRTWDEQSVVATSTSIEYVEAAFVSLGRGILLSLIRIDNGITYAQAISFDSGATWGIQGRTGFDAWTASTDRPPILTTFHDARGTRWVACYYGNESDGRFKVTYALAADLVQSPLAWGAPTTLVSRMGHDFGYGGVIQSPDGSALVCVHEALSASQADLRFLRIRSRFAGRGIVQVERGPLKTIADVELG